MSPVTFLFLVEPLIRDNTYTSQYRFIHPHICLLHHWTKAIQMLSLLHFLNSAINRVEIALNDAELHGLFSGVTNVFVHTGWDLRRQRDGSRREEKRRTRIILIKIVIHEEQKISIKNKSMEEKRKKNYLKMQEWYW